MDKNIHLYGTKVDEVLKKKHSYLIYEIHRCDKELRDMTKTDPLCVGKPGTECETVDPECASEAEIDDWTRNKRAMFKLINS